MTSPNSHAILGVYLYNSFLFHSIFLLSPHFPFFFLPSRPFDIKTTTHIWYADESTTTQGEGGLMGPSNHPQRSLFDARLVLNNSVQTRSLPSEYFMKNHAPTSMPLGNTDANSNRTSTRTTRMTFPAAPWNTRWDHSPLPQTRQYIDWHRLFLWSLNDWRIHLLRIYALRSSGPSSCLTMRRSAI